jgi:hypothetical protein
MICELHKGILNIETMQGVPGGKVNILGGHSIGHSKKKSVRSGIESSRTVIVVTASVKEDERGSQGHTSENLLYQSAT